MLKRSPVKRWKIEGCLDQLKDPGRKNRNVERHLICFTVLPKFALIKKESLCYECLEQMRKTSVYTVSKVKIKFSIYLSEKCQCFPSPLFLSLYKNIFLQAFYYDS